MSRMITIVTMSEVNLHRQTEFCARGFLRVTLVLFVGNVVGHWTAGWVAYQDQQQIHGELARFSSYAPEAFRDMLENWQAEFIGVAWQILGLALLYAVRSPQSREGDERKERKLDRILRKIDPDAESEIARLDRDDARG